jgi:hypothetical protein
MNEVKRLFLLGSSLLLLAGCAQQRRFKAVEQICVSNVQKQQAMDTAEDVLRRMHFTISKADAEQGIIRTRPLAGAQFFEFWRSDNVGTENSVEANLHSLRRAAELNLTQQGGRLCIGCNVNVQRLSIPEFEVSSSSRAYKLFSRSTARMQELKLRREQQERIEWLDMGQDTRLSTEILKRIEAKLKVKNEN